MFVGVQTALNLRVLALHPCSHCSKAFLIEYERGLRVIIFSANAIYPDCNNKSQVWRRSVGAGRIIARATRDQVAGRAACLAACLQGLFWQDFPRKDAQSPQVRVRGCMRGCLRPFSRSLP